jgi:hypothetical protein
MLSNILFSRLTPYVEDIIVGHREDFDIICQLLIKLAYMLDGG